MPFRITRGYLLLGKSRHVIQSQPQTLVRQKWAVRPALIVIESVHRETRPQKYLHVGKVLPSLPLTLVQWR